MRRVILREHEVLHLLKHGTVDLWRLVEPQPFEDFHRGAEYQGINENGDHLWYPAGDSDDMSDAAYDSDDGLRKPPFGPTGGECWGAETWQAVHFSTDPDTGYADDWWHSVEIPAEPKPVDGILYEPFWTIVYKADPQHESHIEDRGFPWRSPATMPRWASRFQSLTITAQEMRRAATVTEAEAEAAGGVTDDLGYWSFGTDYRAIPYGLAFADDWNARNPAHPFDTNPHAWRVTLEVVE